MSKKISYENKKKKLKDPFENLKNKGERWDYN